MSKANVLVLGASGMLGSMVTDSLSHDENMSVDIPDDDAIQADLCASPFDRDSHDRKVLWRKEKIKKELGFSPDDGDALALTFAEPVKPKRKELNYKKTASIA